MSNILRCLAIDDEEYAADLLAEYVCKVPFLALSGTSANPIEALARVQQGEIDVVFLDIQMPELTGLQFLRLCRGRCHVILTTAYPEYALDGYENDVVDYLLKPISFERFLRAAQKALALATPKPSVSSVAAMSAGKPVHPPYLFVKGERKNAYQRVDYAAIWYVEGLNNYVVLHLHNGERLITYRTLRELEQELVQPDFVRVHKSYLVALAHVSAIEGNTLYVGSRLIPIGETYRESFFRLIRERK